MTSENVPEYTLIRSRRKTLALHIKPDALSADSCIVEVRAPLRLAKSEIERFVASKSQWIAQKKAQITAAQSAEPRQLPPPQYAPSEFERTIGELVKVWEQRFGVSVSFVGLRTMTSCWGSCTAKTRRIRLNTALIYCPRECLEYVIVHELAHLRENNHSPRFWAIVSEALPDYKEQQMKIKELSYVLASEDRPKIIRKDNL